MIREILRGGGIMMAWILAGAVVLWLPPAWGALFAAGITILFLLVHAALPSEKESASRLAAARVRSLPNVWSWAVAAVVLTPVWGLTLGFVYNQVVYISELPTDIFFTYFEEGGWLAVTILVVVQGPIAEEFGLRGWIQGALERRMSPVVAIAVAAFLYAVLHGSAEGMLLYFGIGCLFGWAAWQSRSIWASILLHSSYNGSLLLAYTLTESQFAVFPTFTEPVVGGGTLLVLALVCVAALYGVVFLGRGGREVPVALDNRFTAAHQPRRDHPQT